MTAKKTKRPSIGAPPEDRRCQATKKDGTPCPLWAVRGETMCSAHSGRARKGPKKVAAEKVEADVEQARTTLDAAAARVQATNTAVKRAGFITEDDGMEKLQLALDARTQAVAELEEAERALGLKQEARLQEPEVTPEMLERGQTWRRSWIYPGHQPGPDAIRDPSSASWFRWVRQDRPEMEHLHAPANLRPTDPDVLDLVVDRLNAEDAANERDKQRSIAAIESRWREATRSGYATLHYASQAGYDDPQEYLASLNARLDAIHGRDVDLTDESMPEYDEVIAPRLRREAQRRAWHRVGPA